MIKLLRFSIYALFGVSALILLLIGLTFQMLEPESYTVLIGISGHSITLIIGILTVFFPISLSVITANTVGERFNKGEVIDLVMKHKTIGLIKYLIPGLFVVSIFLESDILYLKIFQLFILIFSLILYWRFLDVLEGFLVRFSDLYKQNKRNEIEGFIARNRKV